MQAGTNIPPQGALAPSFVDSASGMANTDPMNAKAQNIYNMAIRDIEKQGGTFDPTVLAQISRQMAAAMPEQQSTGSRSGHEATNMRANVQSNVKTK
jgi:hypothetical protein